MSHTFRVLIVGPLPPPSGGIASSTQLLLKTLSDREDLSVTLIDSAVRWRRPTQLGLGLRALGGVPQALHIWRSTLTALSKGVDLVYINTAGGPGFLRDYLILRSLRQRNVPSLLSIHMARLPDVIGAGGWESMLASRTLSLANEITVLDQRTQEALKEYLPRAVVSRNRNFVDLSEFDTEELLKTRHDSPQVDIIFVGWVVAAKGVLELVEACCAFPGLRLTLVGPVELSFASTLKERAHRGQIRFSITGPLPHAETINLMASARALALPSYTEGLPLVVLEAMALERPVIATPVGAIPEVLAFGTDRPCGRSVQIRDQASLQSAIQDLISHPSKWREIGDCGRQRVAQQYSSAVVVPALVESWKEVARTHTAKPRFSRFSNPRKGSDQEA